MDAARRRLLCLFGWAVLATGSGNARPDTYPSRPIRLIIPWPPGSIVDVEGRVVAEHLRRGLGQPVIVDNRPGGSGMIGVSLGARAKPDGYTLTFASSSNLVIAPAMELQPPYDVREDLQPVTQYSDAPMVLLANPALQAGTVRELIALAKAQPGKLAYGSNGAGGITHIAGELFRHAAGVDVLHVPYKGSPQTQLALLANQIQFSFDFPVVSLSHVQAGRLHALMVTSSTRVPVLPDVPTAIEAGLPELAVRGWAGFVLPVGTPAEIVARLHEALARIVHSPEVRGRLERNGSRAVGSTPEAFRVFIAEEHIRWTDIIRRTGVKAGQ
jgi:tripartite-type tricarboxylate transporter receptor subunit TctC